MAVGDPQGATRSRTFWVRRITAVLVGLAMLAVIYAYVGVDDLLVRAARVDPWLALLAFAFLLPILCTTALRLQRLTPGSRGMPFSSALALTASSGVLNLVLPSRMGDLAKAFFMADRRYASGPLAFSLIVYERLSDLFAMFACCVLGLALLTDDATISGGIRGMILGGFLVAGAVVMRPSWIGNLLALSSRLAPGVIKHSAARMTSDWELLSSYLFSHPKIILSVLSLALLNWVLGIVQVWAFCLALGFDVSLSLVFALAPLALLIGMVPITFAGIGTRDAALVYFFAPYITPAGAAALGVLCTLRYVFWALVGLPFFSRYTGNIGLLSGAVAESETATRLHRL